MKRILSYRTLDIPDTDFAASLVGLFARQLLLLKCGVAAILAELHGLRGAIVTRLFSFLTLISLRLVTGILIDTDSSPFTL